MAACVSMGRGSWSLQLRNFWQRRISRKPTRNYQRYKVGPRRALAHTDWRWKVSHFLAVRYHKLRRHLCSYALAESDWRQSELCEQFVDSRLQSFNWNYLNGEFENRGHVPRNQVTLTQNCIPHPRKTRQFSGPPQCAGRSLPDFQNWPLCNRWSPLRQLLGLGLSKRLP